MSDGGSENPVKGVDWGTDDEEHVSEHSEPWLVSYADMMTLLFGFFVLMYAFASAKLEEAKGGAPSSTTAIRKQLGEFFSGKEQKDPMAEIAKEFKNELQNSELKGKMEILVTDDGLKIVFQSTVLFEVASADLNEGTQEVLRVLARLILDKKQLVKIRVEGYTDDVPIHSEKYPSNWELSSSRSASVVRLFENMGFSSEKLTSIGYGSTRAAFPNKDPQSQPIEGNRARNRRVVLLVSPDLDDTTKVNSSQKTDTQSVNTETNETPKTNATE